MAVGAGDSVAETDVAVGNDVVVGDSVGAGVVVGEGTSTVIIDSEVGVSAATEVHAVASKTKRDKNFIDLIRNLRLPVSCAGSEIRSYHSWGSG